MKKNLSLSVATVLVALSPCLAVEALAQESVDDAAAESDLSEIMVTGSRVRGVGPVGANLIALDRDVLARTGATSTADFLKEVPQITSLGINAEGSLGSAAPSNITRATAPNLRGLGSTATLTILDGRRLSGSGTMGQYVDPAALPLLALERVEVIADGASAIYGSDAVAGVVNLIPRKNFQGVEVAVRGALGDEYSDYRISGIGGFKWTGGNFVLALDRTHTSGLDAKNRSFVTNDRRSFGGANGLDFTCASPGTMTVGGVTYALPAGNGRNLLRANLTPGTSNPCDPAQLERLIPEETRHSVYGYIEQDLTENLSLHFQGLYSEREFFTYRTHPTLNITNVPATNPFRPADIPTSTAIRIQGDLVGDLGRGPSTGKARNYDFTLGLDWTVGEFNVRANASRGEGKDEENRILINPYELNLALADSNPATAFNPFGGPGSNNPTTLARIFSDNAVIGGKSQVEVYDIDLDGPLFSLPGGPVRLAAGAEYRKESLNTVSVRAVAATGLPGITLSDRERDIKSLYGELYVPLFGADNAVPGAQSLALSLAVRWEDYSDFGSTTNPKIGATWVPVDGLSLRGSYGTSFRAPGLTENDPTSGGNLLSGPTRTVLASGDVVYTVTFGGGRADLKPESATTWTLGADFEPVAVPGLRISATYFNIAYKDQIVDGIGGRGTLYLNNPAAYPDLVGFQGTPSFAAIREVIQKFGYTATSPIDYSQSDLVLVDLRRANVGRVEASGLDVSVRYLQDLGSAGQLRFGIDFTRFFDYSTQDGLQPKLQKLNRISYPAKFSGRASIGWDYEGFETTLSAQHVNSYLNDLSLLVPEVDSYTTFDLDLAYRFEQTGLLQDTRISLNVRNLFDTNPPKVDRVSAYDPSKASALGRVVALSLTKRW